MKDAELGTVAGTWITAALMMTSVIRKQAEHAFPKLRTMLEDEEASARWHGAMFAAFVLAGMRESSDLMEAREARIARKLLLALYQDEAEDPFNILDAALSTEEWFQVLRRELAYGLWVLMVITEQATEILGEEDEDADLAAGLGAAILTTAKEWWKR
jgi:hypothetical protein